jgi:hypothetical protein
MSEARELIEKILTEDRIPEFEFGAVYAATVVELVDRGCTRRCSPSSSPIRSSTRKRCGRFFFLMDCHRSHPLDG